MSSEKLLKKLGAMLERDQDLDEKQLRQLRKVLRKLKKNQKELKASLDTIEDERDRHKLQQDIEVLKMQRKKGVKAYKALKKSRQDLDERAAT